MNHRKTVCAWQVSVFTAVSLMVSPVFATEYQAEDLKSFLQEFHSNPAQVMEQIPVKEGSGQSQQATLIPEQAIEGNQFLEAKDQYRSKICKLENGVEICADQLTGRAGIQNNDRAEDLVDLGSRTIKTLKAMDEKSLQSAELSVRPWSDDYWAIYKGVLAYRYGDPNKTDGTDWKVHTDFVKENPSDLYIGQGFDGIQFLSPAEKYDLLVGDKGESLTKKMLNEGRSYYQNQGKVETWMGICHGWAPAAYMMDRPTSQVNVIAADGTTVIPFFPSDIKALGSLLWANVRVYNNFSGGRCNAKDPKKDENGRIIDQQCFDTNPGTWHKSVVNQIGIADRSFIIDATYDYEVWNQPVYSYSYRYFNPETFETSEDSAKVAVDVNNFSKDKFKKYRSSRAKKVVGVEMSLQYIAETNPSQRTFDSKEYDYVTTVRYRYDIELDSRGSIIGGEWYSNKHPDFLWTPNKGARALTRLDKSIEEAIASGRTDVEWKDGEPVPAVWQQYISQYSRQGQPLGLIVEGLIKRSRAAAER
ncbi:MAG: hypothetical protein NXH75_07490 [Halobacteriovoraceae bacterium]|nr:hypothetical protein [Halobacteriovoraceae bacterium]